MDRMDRLSPLPPAIMMDYISWYLELYDSCAINCIRIGLGRHSSNSFECTHSLIPVEVYINTHRGRNSETLCRCRESESGELRRVTLALSVELKLQGFVEASAISFNSCLSPIECNTHVYMPDALWSCG